MKIFLLVLGLLPFIAQSQNVKPDRDNPDRLPEKEFKLIVEKFAPGEIKLPFASIKIIDNRFDTSKFGFAPASGFISNRKRTGVKMIFKEGIAKTLEDYYNEFYQNNFSQNGIQLLIVLKKFWISGVDNKRNKDIDIANNEISKSFLYCKWEYYLNKNELLIPVKRIDTVVNGVVFQSEKNKNMEIQNWNQVFKLILNGLIEVFDFSSAVTQINKLPGKTWADVQQFNATYFDMPALKDSIFNKGVYLNFDEFKRNKPSIINFKEGRIRLGANKYENYLEDDRGKRISNYWGYCTGTDVRIGKYRNEKLYRKNNAFEFFLQHQLVNGADGPKDIWIPYQLDMETGNIY